MEVKMLKRIENEMRGWNAPDFIGNTFFLLFAFILSTFIHELGHFIFSVLLGCRVAILNVTLMQGATGFECVGFTGFDLMAREVLIAYGGGIFAITFGLFLWFSEGKPDMEKGELSNIRLFCIILFFLSTLFQLIPFYKGLDAYYAVQAGLNPLVAWGIWIFLVAIISNIIVSEKKED